MSAPADLEVLAGDLPLECAKCYDPREGRNTGWYMYDENHSKPCELCCAHDQGFWMLTEHHGNPGDMCCKGGCGFTLSPTEYGERYEPLSAEELERSAEFKRLHAEFWARVEQEQAQVAAI